MQVVRVLRLLLGFALVASASSHISLGFHGGSISDSVKPTGESTGFANGRGVASQHEKDGLKRVLRVLSVA
jgi:hypothetical protein